MPISTREVITIPEKTFNKHWITAIEVSSPSPTEEATATCRLTPYNDNGEMLHENTEVVIIRDLLTKSLNADSNIAKAMYFLIAAIDDEYQLQNSSGE